MKQASALEYGCSRCAVIHVKGVLYVSDADVPVEAEPEPLFRLCQDCMFELGKWVALGPGL